MSWLRLFFYFCNSPVTQGGQVRSEVRCYEHQIVVTVMATRGHFKMELQQEEISFISTVLLLYSAVSCFTIMSDTSVVIHLCNMQSGLA